jgi:hypothetical protein
MINYKLIIGTANWFCDYNGTRVDEKQADEIIEYADSVGIREYDTARNYADGKVEQYLANINNIRVYTKGDNIDDYLNSLELLGDKMTGWLVHHPHLDFNEYKSLKTHIECTMGFSVYSHREYELYNSKLNCDVYQMPYWETGIWIRDAVIARKVFAKLTDGSNVNECIEDLMQTQFDRAVIGVDNVEQLKQIVGIWGEL